VTVVSLEISLAALIFSGALAPYVAFGIGFILFGAFAFLALGALTSSIPGTITLPQDTPAAILALIAAGVVANTTASASPEQTFITVVVAILLTTLLTGALFTLFGRFQLSGFVRFIPYPVVGGFLAGTGWLLASGSFSVMTDMQITLATFPDLFRTNVLIHWLPGLLFAVVLLLILRRSSRPLVIPGMLVFSIALFYVLLALLGISTAEAAQLGWLLGPFEQNALFRPLTPTSFTLVDWPAILTQLDKIVTECKRPRGGC
jgi:SulP family sulfate permease